MPLLRPFRSPLVLLVLLALGMTLWWTADLNTPDVGEFSFSSDQRPSSFDTKQKPPAHNPESLYGRLSALQSFPSPPYPYSTFNQFAQVFVVTLKSRPAREQHMTRLAEALGGLDFTFYPARDPMHNETDKAAIERIANWVVYERQKVWHGDTYEFSWSDEVGTEYPLKGKMRGADEWIWGEEEPPMEYEDRWRIDGTGKKGPLEVHGGSDFWPDEPGNYMTAPRIACWLSHYELLRKIAEREDDGPVLILEDDVDFEFDIHRRLNMLFKALPETWDVLFLGHCFSDGLQHPGVPGSPYLRTPHHEMCTHAYAVTPSAARRIVPYLRSPLYAFSRPIDHIHIHDFIPDIDKYTVEPPIVIQASKSKVKGLESDVGTALSTEWLEDSVLDRLERLEEGEI